MRHKFQSRVATKITKIVMFTGKHHINNIAIITDYQNKNDRP